MKRLPNPDLYEPSRVIMGQSTGCLGRLTVMAIIEVSNAYHHVHMCLQRVATSEDISKTGNQIMLSVCTQTIANTNNMQVFLTLSRLRSSFISVFSVTPLLRLKRGSSGRGDDFVGLAERSGTSTTAAFFGCCVRGSSGVTARRSSLSTRSFSAVIGTLDDRSFGVSTFGPLDDSSGPEHAKGLRVSRCVGGLGAGAVREDADTAACRVAYMRARSAACFSA